MLPKNFFISFLKFLTPNTELKLARERRRREENWRFGQPTKFGMRRHAKFVCSLDDDVMWAMFPSSRYYAGRDPEKQSICMFEWIICEFIAARCSFLPGCPRWLLLASFGDVTREAFPACNSWTCGVTSPPNEATCWNAQCSTLGWGCTNRDYFSGLNYI